MKINGSWKTSLFGILAVLPQVLPLLFPKIVTPTVATAISVLFVAAGLSQSKDRNVTGGTSLNPTNDASVVDKASKVDKGI